MLAKIRRQSVNLEQGGVDGGGSGSGSDGGGANALDPRWANCEAYVHGAAPYVRKNKKRKKQ